MLDRWVEDADPEIADLLREIKHDREAGLIRDAPFSYRGCKDWHDAWLYSFRLGRLHPDDHMMIRSDKVRVVVWSGRDFNDWIVDRLSKVAARLGPDRNVRELRMINCHVSPKARKSLHQIIPHARLVDYSFDDWWNDSRLSYADPKKVAEMFPRQEKGKLKPRFKRGGRA